jgi:hypothetical protein
MMERDFAPQIKDDAMTSEVQLAQTAATAAGEDHIEQLLDHALEATFPASDPVALPLGEDPRVAMTDRGRLSRGAQSPTGPSASAEDSNMGEITWQT